MAFKKGDPVNYEIESYIGTIKESDKHNWTKSVIKISWNDNPSTLDIRNLNIAQNRIGRGISLSNEEADRLVDILVENDYGTMETLEEAIKRKRRMFTVEKPDKDIGPLNIDIQIADDTE